MTSDKLRYTAKQETPDTSLSSRTNDNQIGLPLCCGIDDGLSDVAHLDGSVYFKPGGTQLLCNSLDQLTGWLLLNF